MIGNQIAATAARIIRKAINCIYRCWSLFIHHITCTPIHVPFIACFIDDLKHNSAGTQQAGALPTDVGSIHHGRDVNPGQASIY